MGKNILGLSYTEQYGTGFFGHDTSICISRNGIITRAASEERFTRNKHHAGLPWMSIDWAFKDSGLYYDDIDVVAIPWPLKIISGKRDMFIRLAKRIVAGKEVTARNMQQITPLEKKKFVGIDHQLSHAASAYRQSGFSKSLLLSLDGAGSEHDVRFSYGGIYTGENGEISRKDIFTQDSTGTFYGMVTLALGFTPNDGEGKTMGLAAFGDPNTPAYDALKRYAPKIVNGRLGKSEKKINAAITVLNNYQRVYYDSVPAVRELIRRYKAENVAAAAQRILEETVIELLRHHLTETGLGSVGFAGGVALNVKLNKRLRELENVKDIFIYPNPGDAGAAVGAALEANHMLTGERTTAKINDVYLGPEYTDAEIEAVLKKRAGITFKRSGDIAGETAELIAKGKIVGWFQGRMEWGPRALGNRSVLSNPSDVKLKEKLNLRLKQREWFMPFAPSMLAEKAHLYLKDAIESPFMIMAFDVLPERKEELAAVVHVDGTVRPQTVTRKQNRLYYELIRQHEKLTGIPAVLNTSFNKHGLPVVCSPEDAVQHIYLGCIEYLAIGNYLAKPVKEVKLAPLPKYKLPT